MILDKAVCNALAAAATAAVASASSGCAAQGAAPQGPGPPPKIAVTCTISTLCSLVASVGGERIDVTTIVPLGASPETYEPRPSDVVSLSHARLVFENGLGLDAWLRKIVANASARDQTVVTLADAVPTAQKVSGNPHLWMDPNFASSYVRAIESSLSLADPANAAAYRARAANELTRLESLDRWIRARVASIPPEHRAMICFHDAWLYFDRRYGIKNVGAIEPSPGQEPSPGYFARLIALARANHVRAVFGEPQYSPKLAFALQTDAGIKVFSNLYDDTLGAEHDVSTYENMMRYDVSVIVSALRP